MESCDEDDDDLLLVMPSDHLIADVPVFLEAVAAGAPLASEEPAAVRRSVCRSLGGSWVLSTEESRLVVRR